PSGGCYYNYQHYAEGDRIATNEPCLNCTCRNRMLMCYLRVCPFTKAIGQDCTVEKKADQCCPVITCPEVPVQLISSSTESSHGDETGVGFPDDYGCTIDNVFYTDGAQVPSDWKKPCELCYCIRNRTTCVIQECTLQLDGCTPVYQEGICCPVRYNCDYQDHPHFGITTLRPTTTTTTTTTTTLPPTTTPPVTASPLGCRYESEMYEDGELITPISGIDAAKSNASPCQHCYCMRGDIVCAVQECGTPMEDAATGVAGANGAGQNCTALLPPPGKCCPEAYQCESHPVGKPEMGSSVSEHEPTVSDDGSETLPTTHAPAEAVEEDEGQKEEKPIFSIDDEEKPVVHPEIPLTVTDGPTAEVEKPTEAEGEEEKGEEEPIVPESETERPGVTAEEHFTTSFGIDVSHMSTEGIRAEDESGEPSGEEAVEQGEAQSSTEKGLHETEAPSVEVSTEKEVHETEAPAIEVSTEKEIHHSEAPSVEFSTEKGLHETEIPAEDVSTEKEVHETEAPAVETSTEKGEHETLAPAVEYLYFVLFYIMVDLSTEKPSDVSGTEQEKEAITEGQEIEAAGTTEKIQIVPGTEEEEHEISTDVEEQRPQEEVTTEAVKEEGSSEVVTEPEKLEPEVISEGEKLEEVTTVKIHVSEKPEMEVPLEVETGTEAEEIKEPTTEKYHEVTEAEKHEPEDEHTEEEAVEEITIENVEVITEPTKHEPEIETEKEHEKSEEEKDHEKSTEKPLTVTEPEIVKEPETGHTVTDGEVVEEVTTDKTHFVMEEKPGSEEETPAEHVTEGEKLEGSTEKEQEVSEPTDHKPEFHPEEEHTPSEGEKFEETTEPRKEEPGKEVTDAYVEVFTTEKSHVVSEPESEEPEHITLGEKVEEATSEGPHMIPEGHKPEEEQATEVQKETEFLTEGPKEEQEVHVYPTAFPTTSGEEQLSFTSTPPHHEPMPPVPDLGGITMPDGGKKSNNSFS
ncbi:hypothetical protein J437_LFUL017734, partial [Ladona fulva]